LNFAIFKEVIAKPKKRKPRADGEGEETDDSDSDFDSDDEDDKRGRKRTSGEDPYEFDEDEPQSRRKQSRKQRAGPSGEEITINGAGTSVGEENYHSIATTDIEMVVEVSENRFKQFKKLLSEEFRKQQAQSLLIDGVKQILRGDEPDKFSDAEIDACLKRMSDDNAIMISDSVIFWI